MNTKTPTQQTGTLAPIGDKILCLQLDDTGDIHSSLLHIPDTVKGPSRLFQVIRLGTEREDNKEWPVKPGDTIVLPQYSGTDIKCDGKPCKIVATSDILGVYR